MTRKWNIINDQSNETIYNTELLKYNLCDYTDANILVRSGKVTAGTYNFASLIVKIILLGSAFVLSLPAADKTQYFANLSFSSTLELIYIISSDLHKLLKYFNDKAIVAFFRIPLAWFGLEWGSVFSSGLALYLKVIKLSVFVILLLPLVTSSLE